MNRTIKYLLVVLAGISVAAVAGAFMGVSAKFSREDSKSMFEQDKNKTSKDPCWFLLKEDGSWTYEMYQKRQERELHGYPSDIPLAEAVRVFNEEKQCIATLAPYPLLTEDELIASIVAGTGYGPAREVWLAQKDTLFKIAKDKVMPKGSLLVAGGGPNIQESPLRPKGEIKAKGISIAIFLGLENHEFGQDLKQEQIFEIRRTYFSVETIK